MEVHVKVLIPIIVLLALLVITVVVITCYFYIWPYCVKRKKQSAQYSKLTDLPDLTMAKDRRKRRKPRPPTIIRPSTPPPVPTKTSEQSRRYKTSTTTPYYNESMKHLPVKGAGTSQNQFNFLSTSTDKKPLLSPGSNKKPFLSPGGVESEFGDDEIFYFGDESTSPNPRELSLISSSSQTNSDETNNNSSRITRETKNRFRPEPILNTYSSNEDRSGIDLSVPVYREQKYSNKRSKSTRQPLTKPKALSVLSPADGKIEFTLFYNADEKLLTINLVQLKEIFLKAESFIGILSVFDKDQTKERKKSNTVHLIRSTDNTLQLSDYADTGFLMYLTLLRPDMKFSRHTSVVFGNDSAIFNERFTIPCQDTNLKKSCLCIHALCKFGRDGEPIVLGEVTVPLKRLQNSQVLPFLAELQCPAQEIELEPYLKPTTELGNLEIYLSFNPMASKLVVKIIQASSLPKIGMTGHPNVSVKTALYYCNTRLAKETTSIQKRQRSPIFNEMFEFNLSKDRISECDVLFEIRHHGPMFRTVIGYVIVGNSAGGEGTKQWRQLLDFSCHEKQYKIMPKKPVGLS